MSRYWLQRRQRVLRRYRRSQSGVSAIEFALLAPLFFMLLMAIFEVGIMLFSEFTIQNNVTDASRMIRTGEVRTESEFRAQVCGRLANYLDCENNLHIVVESFDDFDEVTSNSLASPLKDGEFDRGEQEEGVITKFDPDAGKAGRVVVARVYYEWSLFAPGMTYMSNMNNGRRLLVGGAAFRNEPFGS
jgi:Flp pilus assembly pilin Flp